MIGIVGQGFVGNAIYQNLKSKKTVYTYDLIKHKSNSIKKIVYQQSIIFICLPTPMTEEGECYIGYIEEVVSEINDLKYKNTVVIKSTVTPGTTEYLQKKYKNINIVFNPEFLTEANAINDFKDQNRIILGGKCLALARMYKEILPDALLLKTTPTQAELVKYITNSYLALKVSYANEIYELCEGLKLNYMETIDMAKLDRRLGNSHWNVPGPDGDRGYGGHCFPKDLEAIIGLSKKLNTTNNLLKATKVTNDRVRNSRDWEEMEGRAVINNQSIN